MSLVTRHYLVEHLDSAGAVIRQRTLEASSQTAAVAHAAEGSIRARVMSVKEAIAFGSSGAKAEVVPVIARVAREVQSVLQLAEKAVEPFTGNDAGPGATPAPSVVTRRGKK